MKYALKLVQSYLLKRRQNIKTINLKVYKKKFSPGYRKDRYRFQFYSIFVSNLFLIVKDVNFASYADDNTIHQSGRTVDDDVINDLQFSAEKLFHWFSDNQMKGNTDKLHLIMSTNNRPELKIGDSLDKTSTYEKLLDLKIDYKLIFDNHVANLCRKANNELKALARATSYMTIEKRKVLINSFFNVYLIYFPLIWMLHSRCNNNKIKHLDERCLRLIYCIINLSYEELLEKDGSVSIHHRNTQNLAIKM